MKEKKLNFYIIADTIKGFIKKYTFTYGNPDDFEAVGTYSDKADTNLKNFEVACITYLSENEAFDIEAEEGVRAIVFTEKEMERIFKNFNKLKEKVK